jgi:hypothetical protein
MKAFLETMLLAVALAVLWVVGQEPTYNQQRFPRLYDAKGC